MARGRFIAFEGGEGCGKSTQARLLTEALAKQGIAAETTREPGGTPGAEAIRVLLLAPPGEGWGPEAEALLFAAARSDHVAKRIRPALEEGRWVVCDRFVDSSRAYQGAAGGIGDEAIQALHTIGSAGFRPDLTILLRLEPSLAGERLAARDGMTTDAIGGRGTEYHAAVAHAFASYAARDPGNWRVIDGGGTPEEVHTRVLEAVAPLLRCA